MRYTRCVKIKFYLVEYIDNKSNTRQAMATINELVSEIAHSVGQPNNETTRRNIRQAIIHARNELIRHNYDNNRYVDKVLMQRFAVSLIDVPDGDLFNTEDLMIHSIKRSANKVPKPTRLSNGMPFQSVRTVGRKARNISYGKEGTVNFYHHLCGFCNAAVYDYINGYIYLFSDNKDYNDIGKIIIESVFETPHLIKTETYNSEGSYGVDIDDDETIDDNEFLIPEDMIGSLKQLVIKQSNLEIASETNEIPKDNLIK